MYALWKIFRIHTHIHLYPHLTRTTPQKSGAGEDRFFRRSVLGSFFGTAGRYTCSFRHIFVSVFSVSVSLCHCQFPCKGHRRWRSEFSKLEALGEDLLEGIVELCWISNPKKHVLNFNANDVFFPNLSCLLWWRSSRHMVSILLCRGWPIAGVCAAGVGGQDDALILQFGHWVHNLQITCVWVFKAWTRPKWGGGSVKPRETA